MRNLFRDRVLQVVKAIAAGCTLSYGEVARRSGNPHAARAVGAIMRANHDPAVPCHRVICADGMAGGYNRGINKKIELLNTERLASSGEKGSPQPQKGQKTKNIRGGGDEN